MLCLLHSASLSPSYCHSSLTLSLFVFGCVLCSPSVGGVLANDADPQRGYMLVHQVKRLGSPCFLVTCHQGQQFPNLSIDKNFKQEGDMKDEKGENL